MQKIQPGHGCRKKRMGGWKDPRLLQKIGHNFEDERGGGKRGKKEKDKKEQGGILCQCFQKEQHIFLV